MIATADNQSWICKDAYRLIWASLYTTTCVCFLASLLVYYPLASSYSHGFCFLSGFQRWVFRLRCFCGYEHVTAYASFQGFRDVPFVLACLTDVYCGFCCSRVPTVGLPPIFLRWFSMPRGFLSPKSGSRKRTDPRRS